MLNGKRVLLIIAGGIAAYKCLDLIRQLQKRGADVRCVLTHGGEQIVTPLAVATLSGHPVHRELFSLTEESDIGHIELSRQADVLLVAPATANMIAKMAHGIADTLATTVLLATSAPVVIAPAMNVRMWDHPATQANLEILKSRGVRQVGPNPGDMACGEYGMGRMSEPEEIVAALDGFFTTSAALSGKRAIVTSGPTVEPIDPVRYIANRSSGKQGHAIASALAGLGAEVTLVSGPTRLPDPDGVRTVHIESAAEMLKACQDALPADIAVCAAAVSDWRAAETAGNKIKKGASKGAPPALALTENPDILATLSGAGKDRPKLVVGFAAETENLLANAKAKLASKGCDWIVANDVSAAAGTFGSDANRVHLIAGSDSVEDWPEMTKAEVAAQLAAKIAAALGEK